MNLKQVKELIEKIDIHYDTDYSKRDSLVKEWAKELKKYSNEDVNRRLEEHLKGEFANTPPKLYYLTKGLLTPDQKMKLINIFTNCQLCGKEVNVKDYDEHYEKCSHIDFIKTNVKKYLDQDINIEEYWNMNNIELMKRWEKIAKIILEKSDNDMLKICLNKYFETKC